MLPTLWPGEKISVEACPVDSLAIDDIAVFARGGCLVVHRVVRLVYDDKGAVLAVTRGDAMLVEDGRVSPADLLGVVTSVERWGREMPLRPRSRIALGTSWMAARSTLAVRVMVKASRWRDRFYAKAKPAP